jgi:hypothetical protein
MRDESKLLTTAEAAAWLKEHFGWDVRWQQVLEWITRGCRGVKLGAAFVRGRWWTRADALRQFVRDSTRQRAAEDALTLNELEV